MKTTVIIPDPLFQRLRRLAAETASTLSAVVEESLRRGLAARGERPKPIGPLPTFRMGRPLVEIADRDALYEAMDPVNDVRRRYESSRPRRKR